MANNVLIPCRLDCRVRLSRFLPPRCTCFLVLLLACYVSSCVEEDDLFQGTAARPVCPQADDAVANYCAELGSRFLKYMQKQLQSPGTGVWVRTCMNKQVDDTLDLWTQEMEGTDGSMVAITGGKLCCTVNAEGYTLCAQLLNCVEQFLHPLFKHRTQFQAVNIHGMDVTTPNTSLKWSSWLLLVNFLRLMVHNASTTFGGNTEFGVDFQSIPVVSIPMHMENVEDAKTLRYSLSSVSMGSISVLLFTSEGMKAFSEEASVYWTFVFADCTLLENVEPLSVKSFSLTGMATVLCNAFDISGSYWMLSSVLKNELSKFDVWITHSDVVIHCSLLEIKSKAACQVLMAHWHVGILPVQLEVSDFKLSLPVCTYASVPLSTCVSIEPAISQVYGADDSFGFDPGNKRKDCSSIFRFDKSDKHRAPHLRSGLVGQMNVPSGEPSISSEVLLKILLILLVCTIALCMRIVQHESLPLIVEDKAGHLCNFTIIFQSSLKTGCIKACLMLKPFEDSHKYGGGAKDWRVEQKVKKFYKDSCHITGLSLPFSTCEDVSEAAGIPPLDDDNLKEICKQRVKDGHVLSVVAPHVLTPAKVSVVKVTSSPGKELLFRKGFDHEGFQQKEKEKSKRRKSSSSSKILKHGVKKSHRSGSPSSPPPASPISKTNASSLVQPEFVASTSYGGHKHLSTHTDISMSSRMLSRLDVLGKDQRSSLVSTPRGHLLEHFDLDTNMDNLLLAKGPACMATMDLAIVNDRANKSIVAESWAAVARRGIALHDSAPSSQSPLVSEKLNMSGEAMPRKPILLCSATFLQAGKHSSRCRISQENLPLDVMPISSSLAKSASFLSMDARAPGSSRLLKQSQGEKQDKKKDVQDREPLYDIWGDYFARMTCLGTWSVDNCNKQTLAQHHGQSSSTKPCFMVPDSLFVAEFPIFSENTPLLSSEGACCSSLPKEHTGN